MHRLMAWFYIALIIGLVACSYPPLSEFGSIDAAPSDALSSDAALAQPFLSCASLPATCGVSGNDNCCTSLEIPAGSYYRSYDLAGDGKFGDNTYPAAVSKFRLDKYEVTVGRFRAFVNAGMGTQMNPPVSGAGGM